MEQDALPYYEAHETVYHQQCQKKIYLIDAKSQTYFEQPIVWDEAPEFNIQSLDEEAIQASIPEENAQLLNGCSERIQVGAAYHTQHVKVPQ